MKCNILVLLVVGVASITPALSSIAHAGDQAAMREAIKDIALAYQSRDSEGDLAADGVSTTTNEGGQVHGSALLRRIFSEAAPVYNKSLDTYLKYGDTTRRAWCGIFALWVYQQANVTTLANNAQWMDGTGVSSRGDFKPANPLGVGDICATSKLFQLKAADGTPLKNDDGSPRMGDVAHHVIVVGVYEGGNKLDIVQGNDGKGEISYVRGVSRGTYNGGCYTLKQW